MKTIFDYEDKDGNIFKQRVPIKTWCENPEEGAIFQAIDLANLPFVHKHVALMPDTHQGYGMPIGGVIACKDVVIPNAVGVDIGCGMAAVKTNIVELTPERLKDIMTLIRKKIPLGFNKHSKPQDENLMPSKKAKLSDEIRDPNSFVYSDLPVVWGEYENALKQLGTLGGGNHFIEIQKGSDGDIWFMVHSGSRHMGHQVAEFYNELAQRSCKTWYSNIPPFKKKDGLAFLPINTDVGQAYLREMQYCLDYAQANRDLMVERIKECFYQSTCKDCNGNGGVKGVKCEKCNGAGYLEHQIEKQHVRFEPTINIHHNYAAIENHFGKNVWVHRKGATSAKEGQLGIIPGSQGTSSYIVKGKGNVMSFKSCSHGAGRKMSRTKAQKNLNLEEEQKKLDEKGIIHGIRGKRDLDEASGAYKDIDIVMKEQEDLIDIVVKLEPLAVIKG